MNGKELISRKTVEQLVHDYEVARGEICQAYGLLTSARDRLSLAFGPYNQFGRFDPLPDNGYLADDDLEKVLLKTRSAAWYAILKASDIRRYMTEEKWTEILKKIESKDMPELTVEEVFSILMALHQNAPAYFQDLLEEVFKTLVPRWAWRSYKTNKPHMVGKKVILSYFIQQGYGRNVYQVRYDSRNALNNVEQVFRILDGKTPLSGYESEMVDKIQTSPNGAGETEYFKFRSFANGNLHLTFKRLDLLAELNKRAGNGGLVENVK